MLDLLDFSSLDIHFDLESNTLLYGENIKCNSCQKVTLKNLSPILLNKSLIYPEQVYEEYKGIYYQQDKNLLNGCISYDLISLPSGLLGIEYIKTHIYFSPIDYGDDKVSCIVEVLFGKGAVEQAEKISKVLFWWEDIMETIKWFTKDDISALYMETWWIDIKWTDMKVLDMFTEVGLTSSNGDAKKMIQSGSLYINEIKVEDVQSVVSSKEFINGVLLLRKGKKQYKIVRTLKA